MQKNYNQSIMQGFHCQEKYLAPNWLTNTTLIDEYTVTLKSWLINHSMWLLTQTTRPVPTNSDFTNEVEPLNHSKVLRQATE